MKKILFILMVVLLGCSTNEGKNTPKEFSVYIVSYHNYPEKELIKLQNDIQNCFDTLIPEITVKVNILNQKVDIPKNCWNHNNSRVRADSLIAYQRKIYSKDFYVLGVTSKDISTTCHNIQDWGVLGLSYCPGKSSVVSNHRISNKSLFYKVATHELLHAFGLSHCKNNDRSCYICDANKIPQLEKQVRLCPDCLNKLTI